MFRPKFRSTFFCLIIYIMNIHHVSSKRRSSLISGHCVASQKTPIFFTQNALWFMAYLMTLSVAYFIVSNGRIIKRQWIGTDAAGSGRSPIWRSNSAFSWNRLRSTTQFLVWVPEIPNKTLVMESQCIYCNLGGWIYVCYLHEFQAS